jgi:hypothetical protein
VLSLGTLLLTGGVALLARYEQLRRKRRKGLLRRLSRLGSQHALRFSSQERLKQYLIGLDGIGRRLLVLRHNAMGNILHWQVVDLQDVTRCSVQTQFSNCDTRLERIALRFERVGLSPCDVVFYQHAVNDPYEASELEQRARHWEVMLTKMLKRATRKTA